LDLQDQAVRKLQKKLASEKERTNFLLEQISSLRGSSVDSKSNVALETVTAEHAKVIEDLHRTREAELQEAREAHAGALARVESACEERVQGLQRRLQQLEIEKFELVQEHKKREVEIEVKLKADVTALKATIMSLQLRIDEVNSQKVVLDNRNQDLERHLQGAMQFIF
jgi:hypothetical protein